MALCFALLFCVFFFSSRRRHTRCALVTGVQTCALPISYQGIAGRRRTLPGLDPIIVVLEVGVEIFEAQRQLVGHHHLGPAPDAIAPGVAFTRRSEEHTSELQSLMRISYAVFCLKKKNQAQQT